MASCQGLYAKLVSMMSPKCSIVETNCELMLMALHAHFLPQQQYSRVYVLFLAFHALVYRWGCPSLSFFLYETDGASLLPKSVRNFLTHFHDFQTNVAILPSVVQAYTQPYSLGGRIKLIVWQIRHELSVTIHEISTSSVKNLRWRTQYYWLQMFLCRNLYVP